MIRHSVCLHRGCFGGCAFCTISAHQGKFIASRSKESIMREVKAVTRMPDFKGYISDLGGPSANMYSLGGKDKSICARCLRPSCLPPGTMPQSRHRPLAAARHLPFGRRPPSGEEIFCRQRCEIRPVHASYRFARHRQHQPTLQRRAYHTPRERTTQSGSRTHIPHVLSVMRKPSFDLFHKFKSIFDQVNHKAILRQQLIPYFISSHPGCTEEDMAELAVATKGLDMHLEQVQDFTPTPMTVATEIYYSGVHPYTLQPIFTAVSPAEKLAQRQYFFWYDRTYRDPILKSLHRIGRPDLIPHLFPGGAPKGPNRFCEGAPGIDSPRQERENKAIRLPKGH